MNYNRFELAEIKNKESILNYNIDTHKQKYFLSQILNNFEEKKNALSQIYQLATLLVHHRSLACQYLSSRV